MYASSQTQAVRTRMVAAAASRPRRTASQRRGRSPASENSSGIRETDWVTMPFSMRRNLLKARTLGHVGRWGKPKEAPQSRGRVPFRLVASILALGLRFVLLLAPPVPLE